MTYTSSREIGRTIDFVPVEASLRNRFSLSDDDGEQLAGMPLPSSTWSLDEHRMG